MLSFHIGICNIYNWEYISRLHLNVPSHVQSLSYISPHHLSQILCQIPKFCLHHVLYYQITKNVTSFIKFTKNHVTIYSGDIGGVWVSLCLQLLILSDKSGKGDIIRWDVSKWAKESIGNILKQCHVLLASTFIFAIGW